jgi:predicted transcriptional regulator
MATRDELAEQAANCVEVSDYADLAMQALQDPADPDYAKELIEEAEMDCSFPAHYLPLAAVAVAMGDTDKARALYDEAEGMCFEAHEKAEVGYNIALHLGDKDKGRELIEEAISETTDTIELLTYAGYIQEALEDNTLANSLYDKVTGDCKSIQDYKALAQSIIAKGDTKTAKVLFEKSAVLNDGADDIAAYATSLVELFDDKAAAEDVLTTAEGDCMFPNDFVAIAAGFQKLLGDKDKAEELLEQGKEFAMSGQENLDLANGYAGLLGDKDTAAELYELALNDFTNKDELLTLAGDVAKNMDDTSLAITAYDKVEAKLDTVADLKLLAQSVNDDLGDKAKVAQIYANAEAKLTSPADLVSLAGDVKTNLDNADMAAAIYQKALDNSKVYADVVKLMDAFSGDSVATGLVNDVLGKALELAEDNTQILSVAQYGNKLVADDNSRVIEALDKAEDNVSSLDEIRKLAIAVNQYSKEDAGRVARVGEKLEKREKSQALYISFQEKEQGFSRPQEYIQLAYDVIEELEDPAYATQLLNNAEEKMKEKTYNLASYIPFIIAVDELVQDQAWLERLLDQAASQCSQFPQVSTVGKTAGTQLSDKDFGRQWLKKFYADRIEQLQASNANAYEYLKMAQAIKDHLDDRAWADTTLNMATEYAETHFHYAYIADTATQWGNDTDSLYKSAADTCNNANDYRDLVRILRNNDVQDDQQRTVYSNGENLSAALDKLQWVEGIVTLFGDKEWAGQAYSSLESSFSQAGQLNILENSRARQLNNRTLW